MKKNSKNRQRRKLAALMLAASAGAVLSVPAVPAGENHSAQARKSPEAVDTLKRRPDTRPENRTALWDSNAINPSQRALETRVASLENDTAGLLNDPAGADRKEKGSPAGLDPQKTRLNKASNLMGAELRGRNQERLGTVKDLAVDVRTGQVPFVFVTPAGQSKMVAVPMTAVRRDLDDRTLTLRADQAKLASAPSFDGGELPNKLDREWSRKVYSHYGVQPSWEGADLQASSSVQNEAAGAKTKTSFKTFAASSEADQRADKILRFYGRGKMAAEMTASQFRDTDGQTLFPRFVENLTQDYSSADLSGMKVGSTGVVIQEAAGADQTVSSASKGSSSSDTTPAGLAHAHLLRSSELIGMNVRNQNNERIGEIKDFVVDVESGRVAYTVVSAGGMLGLSDRLYAVPPTAFTSSGEAKTLVLNIDKARLQNAPMIEKNMSSRTLDPAYLGKVYSYYGAQPYWQPGSAAARGSELRDPSGAGASSSTFSDPNQGSTTVTGGTVSDSSTTSSPSSSTATSATAAKGVQSEENSGSPGRAGAQGGINNQNKDASGRKNDNEQGSSSSSQSGAVIQESSGAELKTSSSSARGAQSEEGSGSPGRSGQLGGINNQNKDASGRKNDNEQGTSESSKGSLSSSASEDPLVPSKITSADLSSSTKTETPSVSLSSESQASSSTGAVINESAGAQTGTTTITTPTQGTYSVSGSATTSAPVAESTSSASQGSLGVSSSTATTNAPGAGRSDQLGGINNQNKDASGRKNDNEQGSSSSSATAAPSVKEPSGAQSSSAETSSSTIDNSSGTATSTSSISSGSEAAGGINNQNKDASGRKNDNEQGSSKNSSSASSGASVTEPSGAQAESSSSTTPGRSDQAGGINNQDKDASGRKSQFQQGAGGSSLSSTNSSQSSSTSK
jgi:sporulation protein YlmC with PRC-barrel domain